MVVTDLHGDRDAYLRYVRRFRELYEEGEVQRLILLGDLIHGYGPPDQDFSVSMVRNVIALREEFGPENVLMLLGNHEMPHIYGVSLFKGEHQFTPRFEHSLGEHREAVMTFFESLPFYVRTAAGVMLSHAGPAPEVRHRTAELVNFDHRAILDTVDAALAQEDDLADLYARYERITGESYDEDAAYLLAINGPDDPRYSHLLRALLVSQQDPHFELLWDALFTQNEVGLQEFAYVQATREFLEAFSEGAPAPQRVIVSGHIITPMGGHALVNRFHLRMSSATHARPREAGHYLLLDCAKPVRAATDLIGGLGSVFVEDDEE